MSEVVEGQALGAADIQDIMRFLPHRFPFLLVDRIVGMRGDEACIGIKNVSANEPQFQGHFPGRPIFPGVMIVEAMAQTAGALCVWSLRDTGKKPSVVYFMTIDECRFRKPVVPGDRLELHMTKIKHRRNMWWFKGEAKVDGALVAEATISAMIVDD
jgi:3-hydroxyacyl-[acyl-carrier-protein] dehydratase